MLSLGGFCLGGFWQGGFLSRGFLSGGLCLGGFCLGVFCPRTISQVLASLESCFYAVRIALKRLTEKNILVLMNLIKK